MKSKYTIDKKGINERVPFKLEQAFWSFWFPGGVVTAIFIALNIIFPGNLFVIVPAVLFGVCSIFILLAILLDDVPEDFKMWSNPHNNLIKIDRFDSDYAYYPIYKEAIDDCIKDLQAGTFNFNYWSKQFRGLYNILEAPPKNERERKDYVALQKEFQATLDELQKKV